MTGKALGLIETIGLTAAIAAADAATKSANVTLVGYENAKGGGRITIKFVGDVGAVKAAVAAGSAAAMRVGNVDSCLVIPRPHDEIVALIAQVDRGQQHIVPGPQLNPPPGEPSLAPTELSLAPAEPSLAPTELSLAPAEPSLVPTELSLAPAELSLAPTELSLVHAEPSLAPAESTSEPTESTSQPSATLPVEPITEKPRQSSVKRTKTTPKNNPPAPQESGEVEGQ